MTWNRKVWLFLFVSTLLISQLSLADDDNNQLSIEDRIYGLSLFWSEVSYNFAFFDQVPDLNWDSAYQEFIPRVISAETTYDYYRVLQRFCALLKDGHTNIYFPKSVSSTLSYPKLLLAEYDHRMFIRNVDSSMINIIPIGSEIIQINGQPSIEFVKDSIMPFVSVSAEHVLWDYSIRIALNGRKGSVVQLTYIKPDGQKETNDFIRDRDGTNWYRNILKRPLVQLEWIDNNIAHLELNSFSDDAIVTEFKTILPELYNAKGVIIDLRYNTGGNSYNGTGILQYFTTDTLWGSTWRSPKHIASFKAWGRYYYQNNLESEYIPYYKGGAWYEGEGNYVVPDTGRKIDVPVVVLISSRTGSAAEDFLIFADKLEHFEYIGEPSNGSTGQPLFLDNFPGGGSVRICTKRDSYPDGRDFVGYGVQPDIIIHNNVNFLIDGSDPVFERAVEELKKITNIGAD